VTDHDVTDYDPRVNEVLDRQVPLRLDAQADWAGALHRAETEGRSNGGRKHGRLGEWLAARTRSRRLLVPVLGVALLVVGGAATAAGTYWWNAGPSAIETNEATSLVEYTLSSDYSVWKKGQTIAIWHMPQSDGTLCVLTALASPKPSAPGVNGPNPTGAGFCGSSERNQSTLPPGKPIGPLLGASLEPGGYRWLLRGNVRSDSGITRLELRAANGSLPIAFDQGWFLAQLPSSSSSTAELPAGGPYVLVGYDSDGKEIARVGLQAFKGPGAAQ
jgi:hypothetical protein